MSDIRDFLDLTHPIWKANQEAWARDERRLAGGDDVLDELVKWKGEDDSHYLTVRRPMAGYLPFPESHVSVLSGHIDRKYPPIDYGSLGEVRSREQVDKPTLAELFDYNCDGIGQDGTQLRSYMNAVQQRAIATGHRWLMMEMPTRATLRQIRGNAVLARNANAVDVSEQDRLEGFRPYLVERLRTVTNWRFINGVLVYAVIREPVPSEDDLNPVTVQDGYYLLVRKGYRGLGEGFSEGGWWWFDAEKKLVPEGHQRWDDTRGQIPLWTLFGKQGIGTSTRPSMSRSLTMEIGQIAVGLMNLRSTRDFNLIQAGKSITYILGGDEDTHKIVVKQHEDGSIVVTVPPVMFADGKVGIPQLWNSAEAAVASSAFKAVIESGIAEAKEIMVRQVTSTPDSSGLSKEAGFTEAISPLLANLAGNRETSDNTMLYFLALRFGKEPNASVTLPREFPIRDLITDIDAMLDSLRRSAVSSSTWEKSLLVRKGDQLGVLPDNDAERRLIEGELQDSIQAREDRKAQAADAFASLNPAA